MIPEYLKSVVDIAAKESAKDFKHPYTKTAETYFREGVQWHHDYLLKDKPEFDEKAMREAKEEIADDTYLNDFNAGAYWGFNSASAQIAALQSEVQRLGEQLEKAETEMKYAMAYYKSCGDEAEPEFQIHRSHEKYFTDKKGGA